MNQPTITVTALAILSLPLAVTADSAGPDGWSGQAFSASELRALTGQGGISHNPLGQALHLLLDATPELRGISDLPDSSQIEFDDSSRINSLPKFEWVGESRQTA